MKYHRNTSLILEQGMVVVVWWYGQYHMGLT